LTAFKAEYLYINKPSFQNYKFSYMIAVYTMGIATNTQAMQILPSLKVLSPGASINVDLSDGEKILRIDGSRSSVKKITEYLQDTGVRCEILS